MRPPVFLIIDGSSLLHRAFYALPPLSNAEGIPTNAVFGFLNMLERLRQDYQPDYLAVALDKSRQTFRTAEYTEYKAQRAATPELLRPQFGLLKDALALLNVAVFELDGYEADDLIGTLATEAAARAIEGLIVTGDRDAWQLIAPGTEVLLTRKGIKEMERFDQAALKEKVGLAPEQIVDWKGLMGDASDNIPGVPGVGEKTALKLLETFGTMEELYRRLPEVKGKLQEKLATHQEQAFLSKRLATIVCDVPMTIDWDACRVQPPDVDGLRRFYQQMEFRSLLKTLPPAAELPAAAVGKDSACEAGTAGTTGTKTETGVQGERQGEGAVGTVQDVAERTDDTAPIKQPRWAGQVVDTAAALPSMVEAITAAQKPLAIVAHWSGASRTGQLVQVGLACGDQAWSVNMGEALTTDAFWSITAPLWTSVTLPKVFFDAKAFYLLARQQGITLQGIGDDGMIAAYLLDPVASRYTLANVVRDQLGWELVEEATLEEMTPAAQAAGCLGAVMPHLRAALTERRLLDLYEKVEMPLVPLLGAMEATGIKVDPSVLQTMSDELAQELARLQSDIYGLAGETFNLNSTQQLGKILFEKLGLPVIKKTKTGYSTDVEVLEQLADRHPLVPCMLDYRQLMKLKSTYLDGLLPLIDSQDGRIHTCLNQTVTATGRLSSTEPNLQNIPVRLEQGRRIRQAFVVPDQDWVLLAADYSQIELRILAHLSADDALVEAFVEEQDIHTRTASEVFGVPMDEVDRELRRRAKAVNFGIIYGISDFGLSRDIGVTRAEAKKYIQGYFARYPKVKGYFDQVIADARRDGFVTTLMGRRRYLPDLLVPNKVRQAFGERTAMNTPIQGTAADLIKAAMVALAPQIAQASPATRMLLQVHDELIFEVPRDQVAQVAPLVRQVMEKTVPLRVPVVVDLKVGRNWYEMKPYTV
ncbi:DNA polymerase I [Heliophilum fasciatum]|uniref:DNA polymerase I n=1 Tax=Heliophilum fasciatum TaxID=35700 RepID=A0A4V2SY70_9FIRM|nr:DNA polymerase I [Heliophilum fasciatum]MCW2276723.1 DNA polymerase-1 [Heliophilum fasciatum]TCP68896.1 DNA polymerase I [Heliophilum fasciatum]